MVEKPPTVALPGKHLVEISALGLGIQFHGIFNGKS